MKLTRIFGSIENKILIPLASISLVTIVFLCAIAYRTEYDLKLNLEQQKGLFACRTVAAALEQSGGETDLEELFARYEGAFFQNDLFLYDRTGSLVYAGREPGEDELVLADSLAEGLGWRLVYSLDRRVLFYQIVEEQRYLVLAAVAVLMILVQSCVFIAYSISNPIRRLSQACTRISQDPDRAEELDPEVLDHRDETGQLAAAFQVMLESIHGHTLELKRLKALNESIVENLPLGVVVYDGEHRPILSNSLAQSMLSRTGERDGEGRELSAVLEETALREEVLPDPVMLHDRDGKLRHYELGVWKLRSREGLELGSFLTVDDVTYKKHMEEKTNQEEKLIFTGRIAAEVAHEARNPLAGIRAGLQVIGRKLEQGRDADLCREMVREVDRVNLLIENLLDISRRRESEKTTVALHVLCEELLMLYGNVSKNKGISLSVRLEEPLWLLCDERELRQILINLINNSIKAMPRGGNLTLAADRTPDGVRLTLADEGEGMEPEKLERVLRGEGGGYGMSIVRQLLRQNGGSIEMESVPGQGTCTRLTFRGTGGAI